MKPLALSTMYAQQDRFDDGGVFARYAAAAGYDGIEISHSTDERKFRAVLEATALPVTSVHQPAPRALHSDGRHNGKLNLASLDETERAAAVAHATESIGWAARAGASRVVVHLGAVEAGGEMLEEEYRMRKLFDSGQGDAPEFAELRATAMARRKENLEPHLAAARRSLGELVAAARPSGITIGLENRYHFHEIPQVEEYEALFEGFTPSEVGYWHDTGHAEVLHRLGFVDRHAWLDRWSSRCVGAHLHDVIGIGDHRAPGDGDVDWGYIVKGVGHLEAYTLEINQWQPDEKVRDAITFLEKVGLR
ncbi:MAG: sugar phosphate isomerase/epimerase [Dehalococcoidia bacterium]|nr:sugar phosphate isomerase/epimerase [Dehalococcoidia bacterium]MCB9485358.1 sugar phosphate isomerase/epimerase [Thermoflexaceae bacterium]